jgi:hypothetical protein
MVLMLNSVDAALVDVPVLEYPMGLVNKKVVVVFLFIFCYLL